MKNKKWFEISADELESRMIRQKIMHDEPVSRSVAMVYRALEEVLKLLGVDPDGDIQSQQDLMGIYIIPMEPAGMTVATSSKLGQLNSEPFAWISPAEIKATGEVYCCAEIYGRDELMEFTCGTKMTGEKSPEAR